MTELGQHHDSRTSIRLRDIRHLPLLQQLMAAVAVANFLIGGASLAVATSTPVAQNAIISAAIAAANLLVGLWLTAAVSTELEEVNA